MQFKKQTRQFLFFTPKVVHKMFLIALGPLGLNHREVLLKQFAGKARFFEGYAERF